MEQHLGAVDALGADAGVQHLQLLGNCTVRAERPHRLDAKAVLHDRLDGGLVAAGAELHAAVQLEDEELREVTGRELLLRELLDRRGHLDTMHAAGVRLKGSVAVGTVLGEQRQDSRQLLEQLRGESPVGEDVVRVVHGVVPGEAGRAVAVVHRRRFEAAVDGRVVPSVGEVVAAHENAGGLCERDGHLVQRAGGDRTADSAAQFLEAHAQNNTAAARLRLRLVDQCEALAAQVDKAGLRPVAVFAGLGLEAVGRQVEHQAATVVRGAQAVDQRQQNALTVPALALEDQGCKLHEVVEAGERQAEVPADVGDGVVALAAEAVVVENAVEEAREVGALGGRVVLDVEAVAQPVGGLAGAQLGRADPRVHNAVLDAQDAVGLVELTLELAVKQHGRQVRNGAAASPLGIQRLVVLPDPVLDVGEPLLHGPDLRGVLVRTRKTLDQVLQAVGMLLLEVLEERVQQRLQSQQLRLHLIRRHLFPNLGGRAAHPKLRILAAVDAHGAVAKEVHVHAGATGVVFLDLARNDLHVEENGVHLRIVLLRHEMESALRGAGAAVRVALANDLVEHLEVLLVVVAHGVLHAPRVEELPAARAVGVDARAHDLEPVGVFGAAAGAEARQQLMQLATPLDAQLTVVVALEFVVTARMQLHALGECAQTLLGLLLLQAVQRQSHLVRAIVVAQPQGMQQPFGLDEIRPVGHAERGRSGGAVADVDVLDTVGLLVRLGAAEEHHAVALVDGVVQDAVR